MPAQVHHIDLHTHTTGSDGLDSPAELVAKARRQGITVLGICDHDSLGSLSDATIAAHDAGITLVPGIELNTTVAHAEIHILGYFVDPTNDAFVARIHHLAGARVRRVMAMVQKLIALGYAIDPATFEHQAATGSVGRPHIARELIRIGAATDTHDAFTRYLTPGCPAYVDREPFSPEDAVDLLSSFGVIPVLAHPFTTGAPALWAERLIPHGLKGFETYYAEYSPEQHQQLRAIADELSLIPTGGSDYHGNGYKEGRELGAAPVPDESWERLRALHQASGGAA